MPTPRWKKTVEVAISSDKRVTLIFLCLALICTQQFTVAVFKTYFSRNFSITTRQFFYMLYKFSTIKTSLFLCFTPLPSKINTNINTNFKVVKHTHWDRSELRGSRCGSGSCSHSLCALQHSYLNSLIFIFLLHVSSFLVNEKNED